jgi:carotenoid cleavage dioxygenase-like enzyme
MDTYLSSRYKETELTKLDVQGELPMWLRGKLVRNGPALYEAGKQQLRHWFDGFGMLHGFTIEEGNVFYQSKFINSPEYVEDQKEGAVKTVTWGTPADPCRSIFRRFFANFKATPTNTPVSVIKIGQRYFTTSDIASLNEFDLKTLDTLSTRTADKGSVMAAHPAFGSSGEVWNMLSHLGPMVKNEIVSLEHPESPAIQEAFTRPKLFYYHSFANTDRYFIVIEQPLYLSFWKLMGSGPANRSFYDCYYWDEQATNKFHIYDRQSGEMETIDSDLSFFFFHTINTYQENQQLIIDLSAYDSSAIIDDFYLSKLSTTGIPDHHRASICRITIDLKTKGISMDDFSSNIELPVINHRFGGRPYRYAYGVYSLEESPRLADAIIKYDYKSHTQSICHDSSFIPGEPVFVENPEAENEDDGVLLVVCHDLEKEVACLVVLDAASLEVIASAHAPAHIPMPLHGQFYELPE